MAKARITITWNGETHTQNEWAEITGIPYKVINSRRQHHYPPEMILFNGSLFEYSRGNPRNEWNYSSAECYKRGCRCAGCDIMLSDLKSQCRMKYSVRELVKKYGAPKREFI